MFCDQIHRFISIRISIRESSMTARFAIIFALLFVVPLSGQQTLLVPSQYATIQSAINAASTGDTVLVSPGTYLERINFAGKGITVASTSGSAATIINAQQLGTAVSFTTGEGPNAILRGFRITGGISGYGGGVICATASHATLEDCKIIGNHTVPDNGGGSSAGGGLAVIAGWAILRRCELTENYASGSTNVGGGGVYIANSSLFPNVASSLTMDGCTLRDNSCINGQMLFGRGGAILVRGTGAVTVGLSSCVLAENRALAEGAIQAEDDATVVQLTNCTIADNISLNGGGGASSIMSAAISGSNCIVFGNTPAGFNSSSSIPIAFDHSDVEGGWPGLGNLNVNPHFADAPNGDFHLTLGSPCINAGTTSASALSLFDIDGDSRIIGPTPDMGADEFSGPIGQSNSASARLEINGVGASTLPGPFVVSITPLSALNFVWHGAPLMPLILATGPLNVGGFVLPGFGSIDVGTPPSFGDISIIFDGANASNGFLFTTDPGGNAYHTFVIPAGTIPGTQIAIQGVVQQPQGTTTFGNLVTAAFRIDVL